MAWSIVSLRPSVQSACFASGPIASVSTAMSPSYSGTSYIRRLGPAVWRITYEAVVVHLLV